MSSFARLDRPRVLVVALAGIGNLAMASPLFRALREAYTGASLDVLVAPRGTEELLTSHPGIRHIHVGHPKPSVPAWFRTVRLLRGESYDLGIVVHPGQLVMSASLLRAGQVSRRIGHRYTWHALRESGLCLTDPVALADHRRLALTDRAAHDVVQNLHLLRPLGISLEPSGVTYDLPRSPADEARADEWCNLHNLGEALLIGLHPGTHGDLAFKRWPADRWVTLGSRIATLFENHVILIFGGPDERTLTAEIHARLRGPAAVVDLPLRAVTALIARCAAFVSNDSGLMHLAASQNVHTFGLFGPTDERRTAPWGPKGHVVRAAGTQPVYDVRALRNDRHRGGPHPSLLDLSADEVIGKIEPIVRAATSSH